MTLITGLATASCSAVLGALLSADMSEKAAATTGKSLAEKMLLFAAVLHF